MLLPAAFMVPLIAQAVGYSDSRMKEAAGSYENAALMQNGLGLMQWLIVAAFVMYFVSYAVDVHQCVCQDEQDAAAVRQPTCSSTHVVQEGGGGTLLSYVAAILSCLTRSSIAFGVTNGPLCDCWSVDR